MVVIAVALFFSSLVVTPALAGMFTAATFVAGRSASYLLYFLKGDHPPAVQTLAHAPLLGPAAARPLHRRRSGRLRRAARPDRTWSTLVAYATAYTGILLLLSVGLFSRREFV